MPAPENLALGIFDGDQCVARRARCRECDLSAGQFHAVDHPRRRLPYQFGPCGGDRCRGLQPLRRGAVSADRGVEQVVARFADQVAVGRARGAQIHGAAFAPLLRHLQRGADAAGRGAGRDGHGRQRHEGGRRIRSGRYGQPVLLRFDPAPLLVGNGLPDRKIGRYDDLRTAAFGRKDDRGVRPEREPQFGFGGGSGRVGGASGQRCARGAEPQSKHVFHRDGFLAFRGCAKRLLFGVPRPETSLRAGQKYAISAEKQNTAAAAPLSAAVSVPVSAVVFSRSLRRIRPCAVRRARIGAAVLRGLRKDRAPGGAVPSGAFGAGRMFRPDIRAVR